MSPVRFSARARRSVVGLLVIAIVTIAAACSTTGAMPDGRAAGDASGVANGSPSTAVVPPTVDRPEPAPRPTSVDDGTPDAVVASFTAAEAAEAYDLSLPLLAASDRAEAGELDGWTDRHAELWPIAGAEITDVSGDDTSATVTTRLRYHSRLDETIGLVPARAEGRWRVVREEGHWRIALADLEVRADVPDDRAAVDAAKAWSAAKQRCSATADQEYAGGLVGFPTVADALCGDPGELRTGAPQRLSEGPDADAFVAAFGPQVLTWSRVVAVDAPVVFRAVLAPVGDRWIVAGLLPPR